MKHVFTLLILSVFLSFYSNQQVFASKAQVISARLNQKIQTTKSDDLIRINIIMKENFDTEQLLRNVKTNFSDEVIENVTVNLSCDSEYITLTDTVEFYRNFELESIIEIEDAFAFEVADNIPGGETLKFDLMAVSGDESWESSFTATANGVAFATGLFTISDLNGNGNGSLDPGENVLINIEIINNGQIAAPEVICNLTSSSPEITINNGRVAYPVTSGSKIFRWVYSKDVFVTSGSDCGWIDYIELPVATDQTMSVNAGADAEICEGVDFQTTATAQNFSSLIWTTSGTGSFDNNTMLNAIYTPGHEDYAAGNVELLLTVFDSAGDSLSDNLLLSFLPLPEIPGNITGSNVVCMGFSEYFSINGSEHAVYYQWELIPETAGTFNSADTTVRITFTDEFTGTAALKVNGVNDCGEGEFSAEFPIQVDDCTGLADFDTSSKISLTPNPNNGVFFIIFADDFEVTSTIKIFGPKG